ncbi:MAG: aa3-type cytochrome oxidase subunit II [Acidimicrobiales bacterium]
MRRRWRGLALALVAGALLAACGSDGPTFGAPRGASRQGRDIFRLWQGSMWAAVAVGVLVWALILYAVVRFRRRPGDDGVPTQTHANIPLEVLYTATPLVIVAVLFAVNIRTQDRVDRLSDDPAVTIEVTAFQWQWRFRYREAGIEVVGTAEEDPVMVLPAGETVRLILRTTDVIHSFYVPAFLYKRDTVPGITNEVDLEVLEEGRYDGRCAEFCGLLHDRMDFVVEAVAPERFDRWLADQRRSPGDRSGAGVGAGR